MRIFKIIQFQFNMNQNCGAFYYPIYHQSWKGSSAGFKAGGWVSLSGYDEKFDVSFGDLTTGL